MTTKVFANGSAIACKAGNGKVTAAFPDVCMSPPPPPAGPVPIPYPVSSFSKDMKSGSKTVLIEGEMVMLKDSSFYATSPLGDEAATRNFGANIVTHGITGKTYFCSWSMDVKFEGKNVPRHIDLTLSNCSSYPGGVSLPIPNMEEGEIKKQQTIAQERIANKQCPCCGESGCVSAFTDDKDKDNMMTSGEFYGLNELSPAKKAKPGELSPRAQKRVADLNRLTAKPCTCTEKGKVFPEPPCDVFRPYDGPRKKAIELAWNAKGERERYEDLFEKTYGRKLPSWQELLAAFKEARKQKTGIEVTFKTDNKGYLECENAANKLYRINHRVPKEAGGCPKGQGNLWPQSQLCARCQELDDMFTKWQGGK